MLTSSQTTFNREEALRLARKPESDKNSVEKSGAEVEIESVERSVYPPPPSYVSTLKIWNGTFTDESLWKIFLRPIPFLLSPVVCSTPLSFVFDTEIVVDMVRFYGIRATNRVVE